jgi:hypothetical protein
MTDRNPLEDPRLGSAVFYPRPDMPYGPEAVGARDQMVELPDGVSLRLRVYAAPEGAPGILFFHGNGETARDYDMLAHRFAALPARLMIGEYRGYGPSSGTPSLLTFLSDAHPTMDAARALLEPDAALLVMGRSMGSAPAIELAATRGEELAGLIVESGFARVVPLLELIGLPARQLGIREEHGPRSGEKMARIGLPTLIIHAEQDEILPIEEADLLFEACADPGKAFLRVPHAGHNDIQTRAGESYFEAIGSLLARIR